MSKTYATRATINGQQTNVELQVVGTRGTYRDEGGRDLIAWADAALPHLASEIQEAIDALNELEEQHRERREHGGLHYVACH